ncbi:phosphate acetyltransferase [Pseudoglutamicibacter albus]|uniref:Phosphate acetyltransferase n=1 Tax=Pseudoglutamicibacter albus DNF00011 TaxID=1401063 RepID=A0A095YBF0_9MICC|nr:phosphate acetyltransferase [Pseudoglutamicibacter albus]KGF19770.1 phosphate acetyltransferase [Pseudoglutamicibacter albus DNF00011]
MTRGLYISATAPGAAKTIIAVGVTELLHRRATRVGFFRPITEADTPENDTSLQYFRANYSLTNKNSGVGLTRSEAHELIASGRTEEIYTRTLETYSTLAANTDVIVIEGTDLTGHDYGSEFELNARLANHLGSHMIGVVNGSNKTAHDVAEAVDLARDAFYDANVSLLSMIVNRANPALLDDIRTQVRPGRSHRKVYVIPELTDVTAPTVENIAKATDARLIAGTNNPERTINNTIIAGMNVGYLLERYIADDTFLITPSDRSDVLLAAVAASRTLDFYSTAGVLVTGPRPVDSAVLPVLAEAPFPVYATEQGTFTTAQTVANIHGDITDNIARKNAAVLSAWEESVDEDELLARLELPSPDVVTPVRFLHRLITKAQQDRRTVVLPEGQDERILRAAEIITRRNICDLIILGGPEVETLAREKGINLTGVTIVDPETDPRTEEFAHEFYELRKHKGITEHDARAKMSDKTFWATMLVHTGGADGMVAGAVGTTADTIRPALQIIKTREGADIVSSVFLMCLPEKVLVYGDCAVNPNPTAQQLASIATASAATARQFDVDPRVAMLSYSTGTSGSGEDVDRVREATELVHAQNPDFPVEGPIQYDAAVDTSIAASKLPDSNVAGHATVLIFPDLNTGNNTYKAVQQSAGAVAVGPVLQGLNKAVNDLSRGTTVADIVNTVAITAIQAQSLTPREHTQHQDD